VPTDAFGREIDYLRISVTDQCNLRCVYCMPMHVKFLPAPELLIPREIETVARVALRVGFRRFRLTGGEPTLRPEIVDIVERLAALGAEDIAMTTNGVRLPVLARRLAAAGLRRVNIHVDTLDADRLPRLMRLGTLAEIEAGISAAADAGLLPVKINCVVTRGYNDADVVDIARRARTDGWHVRFIETMPLGNDEAAQIARTALVPSRETRARIEAELGPLLPVAPTRRSDEARNFRFADDVGGVIGFISPSSEPYCGSCNRMRLTADGKLHLCLLREDQRDLRRILRGSGDEDEIARILHAAVLAKPVGHQLAEGLSIRTRAMFQVGG
jgi:cyclic pyranopterin phosphate synthase